MISPLWAILLLTTNLVEAHRVYCSDDTLSVDQPICSCEDLYGDDSHCMFQRYCEAGTDHALCKDLTSAPGVIWKDVLTDACSIYVKNEWCVDGTYGDNWDKETWGSFHDYVMNSQDATTACCACGGGSTARRDTPMDWTDKDGYKCNDYEYWKWCAEGAQGPSWDENWGKMSDYAPAEGSDYAGMNSFEVCSICGGGVQGDRGRMDSRRRLSEVRPRHSHSRIANDTEIRKARPTNMRRKPIKNIRKRAFQ